MFCITVAVGNLSWRLLFKVEAEAEQAFTSLDIACASQKIIKMPDDFGHTFVGTPTALLLEDLEKTKLAHVELALHQARTNAMATKQAQNDPSLHAGRGPSPAIISPQGNGVRPFGG